MKGLGLTIYVDLYELSWHSTPITIRRYEIGLSHQLSESQFVSDIGEKTISQK